MGRQRGGTRRPSSSRGTQPLNKGFIIVIIIIIIIIIVAVQDVYMLCP